MAVWQDVKVAGWLGVQVAVWQGAKVAGRHDLKMAVRHRRRVSVQDGGKHWCCVSAANFSCRLYACHCPVAAAVM